MEQQQKIVFIQLGSETYKHTHTHGMYFIFLFTRASANLCRNYMRIL